METLKLVHRAMELLVEVSFVALEFVSCIRERQPRPRRKTSLDFING
jgi:hypothetical protein